MELAEEMLSIIASNDKAKCVEEGTTPAVPSHGSPLVSAIITTHNREPGMVMRAVKSVLNQTYRNIELIVVDDSSPSFSRRAKVEQLVSKLSDHILYLKHETCQGACAARNTGLRNAKGYYVSFLDDDDEWMPTKIEEQIKGFCDDRIALVYSRPVFIEDGNHRKFYFSPRYASGFVFEKLLIRNFIGPTSNPLLKKECIDAVGGFDVQMESCQDYDLWLRLALRYPIQYIDAPLLRVHFHSGYRISTDDKKRIKGVRHIVSKYAEYFKENRDAWYAKRMMLVPNYQKIFGRKRAFALWISCVKRCPGHVLKNVKYLVIIILKKDRYKRLAMFYRRQSEKRLV